MSEIIDIFDANLRYQGKMERLAAHMEGKWHKTFHLWLVDEIQKAVLYQLRSPTMVNFPSLLDVTAAGHLEAGETVEEGIREAEEELGLKFEFKSLQSLGYRVEVADQDNGQKNREYQAVYLAKSPAKISDFRPDSEEVYGLVALGIDDGLALFSGSVANAYITGIAFDKEAGIWAPLSRPVSKSDFLPRIQQYYLTVHIMAERLLEGRSHLAIS